MSIRVRRLCQVVPPACGALAPSLPRLDEANVRETPAALRQMCIGRKKLQIARSSECDIKRIGRGDAVSDRMCFKQKRRKPHSLRGERGQTYDNRVEAFAV